jgi:hypothetical protein
MLSSELGKIGEPSKAINQKLSRVKYKKKWNKKEKEGGDREHTMSSCLQFNIILLYTYLKVSYI